MIKSPTTKTLQEACQLLLAGDLVAIPTETVYGLAADATNEQAVAKIYAAKSRPQFNPLIIHHYDVKHLEDYVEFNDLAYHLAAVFWPGPLTMVLPRRSQSEISHLAGAGLNTLAVRVPNHPVTLALLKQLQRPLAAPSANRSNTISPTTASDVLASLGERVPLILDGGAAMVGLESTILDLTTAQPTILRPGGVSLEEIAAVIGPVHEAKDHSKIKAPGMMKRHYAPCLPLRLQAVEKRSGEFHLGFGAIKGDISLSDRGDLQEAAANLFRMLRDYDNPERYQGLAVAPIPNQGLGRAINDRLHRASAQEE